MPAVGSLLLKMTVTSDIGLLLSAAVNCAVPPDTLVVKPLVGVILTPAVLVFMFVTATSGAFVPLNIWSLLTADAVTMVKAISSRSMWSLTPVTVTV